MIGQNPTWDRSMTLKLLGGLHHGCDKGLTSRRKMRLHDVIVAREMIKKEGDDKKHLLELHLSPGQGCEAGRKDFPFGLSILLL